MKNVLVIGGADPNTWVVRDDDTKRFVRTTNIWDGSVYDEGYVDNKGRFRVYRPDCPRAFADGYALRAHVVWWLHHGACHPEDTELHHTDENKLNDSITNLEPLSHSE